MEIPDRYVSCTNKGIEYIFIEEQLFNQLFNQPRGKGFKTWRNKTHFVNKKYHKAKQCQLDEHQCFAFIVWFLRQQICFEF